MLKVREKPNASMHRHFPMQPSKLTSLNPAEKSTKVQTLEDIEEVVKAW
jgi:hypothetical protein